MNIFTILIVCMVSFILYKICFKIYKSIDETEMQEQIDQKLNEINHLEELHSKIKGVDLEKIENKKQDVENFIK